MAGFRGPNVSARIKNLLADIYRQNRQIGTTEARSKLLENMKREGLDEVYGADYPSMSAVHNKLKELRNADAARPPESKELDEPWTIFTLAAHPIPPEALPAVLCEYRRIASTAGKPGDKDMMRLFTIRHAQWLARLSALRSPETCRVLYRILSEAEALAQLTGNWPEHGLFEEALAASEANDLEGEAAAMGRFADWSTSEIAKLLGPQGENFMAQLKELEGKWARKREKGEK